MTVTSCLKDTEFVISCGGVIIMVGVGRMGDWAEEVGYVRPEVKVTEPISIGGVDTSIAMPRSGVGERGRGGCIKGELCSGVCVSRDAMTSTTSWLYMGSKGVTEFTTSTLTGCRLGRSLTM